jgi:molybdenum cofactor cytidylyltransferase
MISCVLLSAGLSIRFGSPKALARLNHKTAIEHLQSTLLSLHLKEIIIVLGHEAEKIRPFVVNHKKVEAVYNKNYKLGQTSSFKTGLKEISRNSTGIMLLPIDYLFIRPQTLARLITFFEKKRPMFLIPTYQGKRGHPLFFNPNLKKLFLSIENSTGANAVIHQHGAQVTLLPVNDIGVVSTFNTPDEFENIKKEFNEHTTHDPFIIQIQ